jgi:3D (Asp-Asp-Asp) domain-containing protein
VRGPFSRTSGRVLALSCAVAAALWAAAGGGARRPQPDVQHLRRSATSLAARRHAALLDLYSIETRLTAQRARLTALRGAVAEEELARRRVRQQLGIAARAHRFSQQQLAERLTELYERGSVDPVAIVLGASSLDEAVSSIDALDRSAEQNRVVIRATLRSKRKLTQLGRRLAARTAQLVSLRRQAEASVAALEEAQAQHVTLAADLRRREQLTRRQIATLDATARAAQAKTQQLTAASDAADPPAAPAPGGAPAAPASSVPPAGGTKLTVTATGYSMQGHTATGLPVGWGVAAVDPSVIPLGTRMTVPGYGEAVAADTGGSVRGATIDLWFPTLAQARAWGRRTVTIALH